MILLFSEMAKDKTFYSIVITDGDKIMTLHPGSYENTIAAYEDLMARQTSEDELLELMI